MNLSWINNSIKYLSGGNKFGETDTDSQETNPDNMVLSISGINHTPKQISDNILEIINNTNNKNSDEKEEEINRWIDYCKEKFDKNNDTINIIIKPISKRQNTFDVRDELQKYTIKLLDDIIINETEDFSNSLDDMIDKQRSENEKKYFEKNPNNEQKYYNMINTEKDGFYNNYILKWINNQQTEKRKRTQTISGEESSKYLKKDSKNVLVNNGSGSTSNYTKKKLKKTSGEIEDKPKIDTSNPLKLLFDCDKYEDIKNETDQKVDIDLSKINDTLTPIQQYLSYRYFKMLDQLHDATTGSRNEDSIKSMFTNKNLNIDIIDNDKIKDNIPQDIKNKNIFPDGITKAKIIEGYKELTTKESLKDTYSTSMNDLIKKFQESTNPHKRSRNNFGKCNMFGTLEGINNDTTQVNTNQANTNKVDRTIFIDGTGYERKELRLNIKQTYLEVARICIVDTFLNDFDSFVKKINKNKKIDYQKEVENIAKEKELGKYTDFFELYGITFSKKDYNYYNDESENVDILDDDDEEEEEEIDTKETIYFTKERRELCFKLIYYLLKDKNEKSLRYNNKVRLYEKDLIDNFIMICKDFNSTKYNLSFMSGSSDTKTKSVLSKLKDAILNFTGYDIYIPTKLYGNLANNASINILSKQYLDIFDNNNKIKKHLIVSVDTVKSPNAIVDLINVFNYYLNPSINPEAGFKIILIESIVDDYDASSTSSITKLFEDMKKQQELNYNEFKPDLIFRKYKYTGKCSINIKIGETEILKYEINKENNKINIIFQKNEFSTESEITALNTVAKELNQYSLKKILERKSYIHKIFEISNKLFQFRIKKKTTKINKEKKYRIGLEKIKKPTINDKNYLNYKKLLIDYRRYSKKYYDNNESAEIQKEIEDAEQKLKIINSKEDIIIPPVGGVINNKCVHDTIDAKRYKNATYKSFVIDKLQRGCTVKKIKEYFIKSKWPPYHLTYNKSQKNDIDEAIVEYIELIKVQLDINTENKHEARGLIKAFDEEKVKTTSPEDTNKSLKHEVINTLSLKTIGDLSKFIISKHVFDTINISGIKYTDDKGTTINLNKGNTTCIFVTFDLLAGYISKGVFGLKTYLEGGAGDKSTFHNPWSMFNKYVDLEQKVNNMKIPEDLKDIIDINNFKRMQFDYLYDLDPNKRTDTDYLKEQLIDYEWSEDDAEKMVKKVYCSEESTQQQKPKKTIPDKGKEPMQEFGRRNKISLKNKRKMPSTKNFIQRANARSKKKGTVGSFRRWCKSRGLANKEGKVTMKCIKRGLRSKNVTIRRRANFARNIKGYSRFGKSKTIRYTSSQKKIIRLGLRHRLLSKRTMKLTQVGKIYARLKIKKTHSLRIKKMIKLSKRLKRLKRLKPSKSSKSSKLLKNK